MESSPMAVAKESINKLIKKGLYLVAAFNYPKVKKDYRYHIRENYFCRLYQIQFFIKDYLKKQPYKVIDFPGEFETEIRYVIPFAYWHFLNGTLAKTISCKNTSDFYFFSKNHEEKYTERDWQKSYASYDVPNMTHSASFSYKKWARVPFKKHFANDTFKFEKPILVIANKYNIEWDQPPINFYSIDILNTIILTLKNKYQIIYNRPLSTQITSDNSDILDLHEYEWLKENHPDVILMNDLFTKHRASLNSFNQLQMQVYANCSHFISAHGGTAALASYFEGTNIILSKCGIEHELGEYNTIMPALSGAKILHAKTESDVLKFINQNYL